MQPYCRNITKTDKKADFFGLHREHFRYKPGG